MTKTAGGAESGHVGEKPAASRSDAASTPQVDHVGKRRYSADVSSGAQPVKACRAVAMCIQREGGPLPARLDLAEFVDVGISEHTREVCDALRNQETYAEPDRVQRRAEPRVLLRCARASRRRTPCPNNRRTCLRLCSPDPWQSFSTRPGRLSRSIRFAGKAIGGTLTLYMEVSGVEKIYEDLKRA